MDYFHSEVVSYSKLEWFPLKVTLSVMVDETVLFFGLLILHF